MDRQVALEKLAIFLQLGGDYSANPGLSIFCKNVSCENCSLDDSTIGCVNTAHDIVAILKDVPRVGTLQHFQQHYPELFV